MESLNIDNLCFGLVISAGFWFAGFRINRNHKSYGNSRLNLSKSVRRIVSPLSQSDVVDFGLLSQWAALFPLSFLLVQLEVLSAQAWKNVVLGSGLLLGVFVLLFDKNPNRRK